MKKGDRVRTTENFPYLNVTKRHVGVVVSQSKYKLPKGTGSIHPNGGWDVEVKFRHKNFTTIFQGEELQVIPGKDRK